MIDTVQPATRVALFDEFLVGEEWNGLLEYTYTHEYAFVPTSVIRRGEDHLDHDVRRSLVLFDLERYHDIFVQRLLSFFPQILTQLDYPWFPVGHVEVQMTGTGDGEYFRMHTDNGSNEVATRAITFVYFYFREPRPFAGGELQIHDTTFDNGQAVANGSSQMIVPAQNQVVFFPSHCFHEIRPVDCPSGAFADRRFTVNGWFHV